MVSSLNRSDAWVDANGKPTDRFAQAIEDLIKEVEEMSVNKQLFLTRPANTDVTNVYTSPTSAQGGRGTIIKQMSATDPAGAATFSVYVGAAGTDVTRIVNAELALNEGTRALSLYDLLVSPGESIFIAASAGNTVVFSASGVERRG